MPKTKVVESPLPRTFAAALFAFFAAMVLMHPTYPLLGDLSDWTYSGALLARHIMGLPDPHHTLKLYPVPNSFLTVLLGVLTVLLGSLWAVKTSLCLYFALCFAAIRSLARAAESSASIWWIAPGFFLTINLWWGFFAFQFGVLELMFFAAALLRDMSDSSESPRRRWWLAFLLLLLFFTHMVPFTFACILLFFYALQTNRLRLLYLMAIPALLLITYATGRAISGNTDSTALPPDGPVSMGFMVAYKVNTFAKSFGFPNPMAGGGSLMLRFLGEPLFLALFAVNLVLIAVLAYLILRAGLLRDAPQRYSFAWLTVAITLPVYVIVPRSLLGISDPGSRILQTALWLGLFFCMRPGVYSRLQRIASSCAVLLAVANAVLFVHVPWHVWPPRPSVLPAAIETLAKAPNAYGEIYLRALQQENWKIGVFPTGILINHDAPRLEIDGFKSLDVR